MVRATINYVQRPPPGEKLVTHTVSSPHEEVKTNVVLDPHEVDITDGRNYEFDPDREGFQLLKHDSKVLSKFVLHKTPQALNLYYNEAALYVKKLLSADKVFVFNHVMRHNHDKNNYSSILRAHVDQSAKSGPERVRDHFPNDAERLLKGRVRMLTMWRPLAGPIYDDPLALVDCTSLGDSDLIPADLVLKHRVGENYAVAYNPCHKWYYFSAMQPNEVLLFKGYDSKEDVARFVPHSAFTLPEVPEGAKARQSIEIRMLIFSNN